MRLKVRWPGLSDPMQPLWSISSATALVKCKERTDSCAGRNTSRHERAGRHNVSGSQDWREEAGNARLKKLLAELMDRLYALLERMPRDAALAAVQLVVLRTNMAVRAFEANRPNRAQRSSAPGSTITQGPAAVETP